MENNELIMKKLESLGENYDSLQPFIMDYLSKIESAISKEKNRMETAINTLQKVSLSLRFVASSIGCSRTTLYNNRLLKKYAEFSESILRESKPYHIIADLQVTIRKLRTQVESMIVRDIKMEIIEQEKQELLLLLEEKQREISYLQSQVNKGSIC